MDEKYFWDDFSQHGDSVALIYNGRKYTYSKLNEDCQSFATQLGVKKQLIELAIDNSYESVVALYGALIGGHAVLLCDSSNDGSWSALKESFHPNCCYSKVGDSWKFERFDGIPSADLNPDLALVISTSGSTGSGKCVKLSRKNISSNADSIASYLKIQAADAAALILPLHYCYGLSVLSSHLFSGACVHVGDLSVASEGFIDYLEENSISSVAGVPYTFEILERAHFRKRQLPNLRYLTQAGGRLAPELVEKYSRWAEENSKQFFVMYGQTEATARIAYLPPEKLSAHVDCIGVAIPGGELSIKDEQGNAVVASDVAGELIYRGDNIMMGYAENFTQLKQEAGLLELATGDLACKNSSGLFYIVGRLKRFAKIYGKRFNLDEIEKYLYGQGVNAVCVSDDERLYVCYEDDHDLSLKAIMEKKFGIAERDVVAFHLDVLPLLSSGKLDYRQVLAIAVEKNQQLEAFEINNPQQNKGTQLEKIIGIYRQFLKVDNIVKQDSFSALGGDSLNYVGVSIELERLLGFIPVGWEKKTIESLASLNRTRSNNLAFSTVETGVVLRVYAVVAVVLNHAGMSFLRGGAALLLILAGFNYMRFQFDKQILGKPFNVFGSLLVSVFLPYWFVLIGFSLLKNIPIDPYDVLLLGNNISGSEYTAFGVWFIQAMFQSLLVFSIPLLLPSVRVWVGAHKLQYVFGLLLIACLVRLYDGYTGWGEENLLNGSQLSWVFWLFCLGACLSLVETSAYRSLLSVAVLFLPLGFYWGDFPRIFTLAIGGLFLLYLPLVAMPRWLVGSFQILGASSLFIYMLHPRAPIDSLSADWPIDIVRISVGILLGVVGYYGYTFGVDRCYKLADKIGFGRSG